MTVHTLEELVGFNVLDAFEVLTDPNENSQPMVNIGPGLDFVPDSPFHPRQVPLPLRPVTVPRAPWGQGLLGGIFNDDDDDAVTDNDNGEDDEDDEDDDGDQMGQWITTSTALTGEVQEESPGNSWTQQAPQLPPGLFANVTFAEMLPLTSSWELMNSEEDDKTTAQFAVKFLARMCRDLRRTHGNMYQGPSKMKNGDKARLKVLTSNNRLYFPHLKLLMPVPADLVSRPAFLRRDQYRLNLMESVDKAGLATVSERYRFLRMYEKDIEMRKVQDPAEKQTNEYSVLCPGVVVYKTKETAMLRRLFHGTSRLNMTAHVPELCLVVVGSAQGNVVLVTPTRLAKPIKYRRGTWKYGFRVEYVLPRRSDEEARRAPQRPLHGIAVGPVVQDGDATSAAIPKRFRLMIHFRNHDILTYELTREQQTGKLCIL